MPRNTGVFRRLPLPRALLIDILTIEKPSQTPDGQGGFVDTWSALATNVRGIVMDSSPPSGWLGGQFVALGALGEHVTHHIWLRYDVTGLDATCRVLFNGKHFRVHDVGHWGGNVMIFAEEVR